MLLGAFFLLGVAMVYRCVYAFFGSNGTSSITEVPMSFHHCPLDTPHPNAPLPQPGPSVLCSEPRDLFSLDTLLHMLISSQFCSLKAGSSSSSGEWGAILPPLLFIPPAHMTLHVHPSGDKVCVEQTLSKASLGKMPTVTSP